MKNNISLQPTKVLLAGGKKHEVPVAQVTLDWGNGPMKYIVGVMENSKMMLGTSVAA